VTGHIKGIDNMITQTAFIFTGLVLCRGIA